MRSTGLAIVLITSRIWAFDWYKYRWPWMTLNGEMALILHYFTEFVYDVVVKQLLVLPRLTFAISFSDELLFTVTVLLFFFWHVIEWRWSFWIHKKITVSIINACCRIFCYILFPFIVKHNTANGLIFSRLCLCACNADVLYNG